MHEFASDIERLRRSMEAIPDIDAVLGAFADDAIWESVDLGFHFEGVPAIRGFLAEWYGSYAEIAVEAEELRDLDEVVFFAVLKQEGRLHDSAGTVSQRSGIVVLMRDGLIAQVFIYPDIDEGRAAAERLAE